MVNVHKYQVVAIGDTVNECEERYQELLLKEGIQVEEEDTRETQTLTGKITKIARCCGWKLTLLHYDRRLRGHF